MKNGPMLVFPGAILGCIVVCVLASLLTGGLGGSQLTALAAAEPAAGPAAVGDAGTAEGEGSEKAKPGGKAESNGKAEAAVQAAAAEEETQAKQPAKKNKQPKNGCTLASSYPQSILQWCSLIEQAAKEHGLPGDLIAALILQESGGQALAYSKSGAVGLMQVMPRDGIAASFQCVNGPCFASRPTIQELQDPAFNIEYGTRFLAGLVERRGSLREALYAYGPMGVGYSYADKVLGIYEAHGGN